MKLIRFVRHCDIYMPGEVAGFDDPKADALVQAGAAVPVPPVEQAVATADEVPAGEAAPVMRRRKLT